MSIKQPTKDERISRNLDLLGEFLQAAIADASILDEIPDGAELIFEPEDDSDTTKRLTEVAKREGRPAVLVNLSPSRTRAGAAHQP